MVGGIATMLAATGSMRLIAGDKTMFGMIGKFTAKAGTRDDLVAILLGSISGMPGCLNYVVATDPSDDVTIWITEVWDNADSHKASLQIPAVQAAIKQAMPMIGGIETVAKTRPVGGHGI